jgi:uroporphyrin-III C-methyltransferase / precorrin-2 dehydrogenase / sirohydrochlorin ferrochelatase
MFKRIRRAIESAVRSPDRSQPARRGLIQLVGAGPGDPELMTIKAFKAMQRADVVLHDRLVGKGVLALARKGAQRIYVGKIGRGESTPQRAIEALMVAEALKGKRVVRLKGGDPFIFGRGGEELEAARAAGIPVEVVPGVSAALGAAAALQIPLTHRDHAQTLIFATGHCKEAGGQGAAPNLDWRMLSDPNATLAIYMGIATAGIIAERLQAAGRDPATPVAIVENATLPNQRVVRTRLERMANDLAKSGIAGPALLLIGEAIGSADDANFAAYAAAADKLD